MSGENVHRVIVLGSLEELKEFLKNAPDDTLICISFEEGDRYE